MSVSPETEWILVATGLIAHADGHLDGNEVERLMAMIDDRIPTESYSDWLGMLGDAAALEARYAELPSPAADQHESLLEEAWTMAMVDESENVPEIAVLERIAGGLGITSEQLSSWRASWRERERNYARRVAELLAYCLGGGQPIEGRERGRFERFVDRLPARPELRTELYALAAEPRTDADAIASECAELDRSRRVRAFRLVGRQVGRAADQDKASERFGDLVRLAGLLDTELLAL